jgi:hypothetical protein
MDIVKQAKNNLYNRLLKDEKFKKVINLSNELFLAWNTFTLTDSKII